MGLLQGETTEFFWNKVCLFSSKKKTKREGKYELIVVFWDTFAIIYLIPFHRQVIIHPKLSKLNKQYLYLFFIHAS